MLWKVETELEERYFLIEVVGEVLAGCHVQQCGQLLKTLQLHQLLCQQKQNIKSAFFPITKVMEKLGGRLEIFFRSGGL